MSTYLRMAVVLVALVLALAVVAAFTRPELSAAVSAVAAVTTATISSLALAQVRRDSRNSSRPMVAASLRPAELEEGTPNNLTRSAQELVVRNYGPSLARDVSVSFEPELPHSPGLGHLIDLYSKPVPVMVPGAELLNVYYSELDKAAPEQVTAIIRYTDADGVAYGPDLFRLDLRVVRGRTSLLGDL